MSDPDGTDARVTVNGDVVTISTTIYIYGPGASQMVADVYKDHIMNDWNKGWTYSHSSGKTLKVSFDVSVKLYNAANPTAVPRVISESWNPSNTDNFIRVEKDQRDYVSSGDEGTWSVPAQRKDGALVSASAHEFGHLIGLTDRYDDIYGSFKNWLFGDATGYKPHAGWEGNMMAEAPGRGKVEQRNIDAVLKNALRDYKGQQEFKTKIDESSPSW